MQSLCQCCRNNKVIKVGVWVYRCPTCGHLQYDDGSPALPEIEYESIYEDRPEGCIACDADTYPMCREGCPLINN